MKILKFILIFILAFFILAGTCLFYAFKIEPYRITVNEFDLNEEHANGEPVKIVQFSDVHIKEDFTYENLDKVVNKINEQNPDIVVFTGDLYDNYGIYNDDVNIISELNKINAKYAKISIWGNRDYGSDSYRYYEDIMEKSGFKLLENGNWYVSVGNGKRILFTGLDDSMLGKPYMPDSTKIYRSDYDILLAHEPDNAAKYNNYSYDLYLSGHSHGGQIDILFLPSVNEKAVSITSLSTKYVGGMYSLDSANTKKMYVNTGIGTTHISARFGVVPEISLFNIYL